MKRRLRDALILCLCGIGLLPGCRYDVPDAKILVEREVGPARKEITYDMTGDGKPDYTEVLADGVVEAYRFEVDRTPVRTADVDPQTAKHVFVFLDGVPFALIEEMWQAGHFRMFHRPGRLIGPFPSLTDVSYSQMFHIEKPDGYESAYLDRDKNRLTDGTNTYLSGRNEPWARCVDYRMPFLDDAIMYLYPRHVFRQELKNTRAVFERSKKQHLVLYLLSSDGLCHMRPWEEVKEYLAMLETWLRRMIFDYRGKLHLTMLADHGNDFVPCRMAPVKQALKDAGLKLTKSLGKPGQVVVPLFGLINSMAIHTSNPTDQRVAIEAMLKLESVDLVFYRERSEGPVVVRSRDAEAVFHRKAAGDGGNPARYKYEMRDGDPLDLNQIVTRLRESGKMDADGYAAETDWLSATGAHRYPDPLRRTWEALTNSTENPADVLVSFREGWCVGDQSLAAWVTMKGTHGALQASSATSFVMSSAQPSPDCMTTHQVLDWIQTFTPWNPDAPNVKAQR